jgi:rubredoxin
MKSGSWSSYRAAMPIESRGEPDDGPRRHTPPRCDGCGRFFSGKPGSDARLDITPDSIFGPESAEWLCPACAARTPLPPTEAEMREAEREADEAYTRALAEEADREAADIQGRCQWCGAKLPAGRVVDVCAACEAGATAAAEPCDGDEIPW